MQLEKGTEEDEDEEDPEPVEDTNCEDASSDVDAVGTAAGGKGSGKR